MQLNKGIVGPLCLAMSLAACGSEPDNVSAPPAQEMPSAPEAPIAVTEPGRPDDAPAPAEQAGRSSAFTPLTAAACTLVEENREEAGYWLRRCPGSGPYRLEWSESDLRQGLTVISGARRERLETARLVTDGAFNTFGKTIEWRGRAGGPPDRLVARVEVADADNPQGPDISKLIVVRLDPETCIIAVVEPGPAQSSNARAIADSGRKDCLGE